MAVKLSARDKIHIFVAIFFGPLGWIYAIWVYNMAKITSESEE